MDHTLPAALRTYLDQRHADRTGAVERVVTAFTDRERALVKEAAVMGYVQGTWHPRDEPIPGNNAILAAVIDACLHHSDLYPTLGQGTASPDSHD